MLSLLALIASCASVIVLDEARVTTAASLRHNQARSKTACIDEQEKPYSLGALRKVNKQIQKCEAGEWVMSSTNGEPDPAVTAKKEKSCLGVKNQEYASGVLRPSGTAFERCKDGQWVGAQ
jgi:hypothetical protein